LIIVKNFYFIKISLFTLHLVTCNVYFYVIFRKLTFPRLHLLQRISYECLRRNYDTITRENTKYLRKRTFPLKTEPSWYVTNEHGET